MNRSWPYEAVTCIYAITIVTFSNRSIKSLFNVNMGTCMDSCQLDSLRIGLLDVASLPASLFILLHHQCSNSSTAFMSPLKNHLITTRRKHYIALKIYMKSSGEESFMRVFGSFRAICSPKLSENYQTFFQLNILHNAFIYP